jgi:hypothetical protein
MKSPGKFRDAAGSGRRDVVEGVPAGTVAHADRKFLTVSVTVFLLFKKHRSAIHTSLRRLFKSTYPKMFQEVQKKSLNPRFSL